jgi:regulatory protein
MACASIKNRSPEACMRKANPGLSPGRPRATAGRVQPDPYTLALSWLALRELTSAQIADRLHRRGFQPAVVEDVVARLLRARALDDRRVAGAMARTAVEIKRRGPARVLAELQRAGIDRETARQAVKDAFGALDENALIDKALSRRLRGQVLDASQFRRLYAYLVRQGFSPTRAVSALKARAARGARLGDLD